MLEEVKYMSCNLQLIISTSQTFSYLHRKACAKETLFSHSCLSQWMVTRSLYLLIAFESDSDASDTAAISNCGKRMRIALGEFRPNKCEPDLLGFSRPAQ